MHDRPNSTQQQEGPHDDHDRLTRRDLLARVGATVAVGGIAAGTAWWLRDPKGDAGLPKFTGTKLPNYFARVAFPASNPRLSIARGPTGRIDEMVEAAVRGLDGGLGISRFIERGDVVLIKPNVGFGRPPRIAATTHPEVVRSVIRLCKKADAKRIIVADNPMESPEACFAKSGIGAVGAAEGAEVMLHTQAHDAVVTIRDNPPDRSKGEAFSKWPAFLTPLRSATKVIGVPVVKDHNRCSASMAMKNWYGLLSGPRAQLHQAIHETVSDLGLMISPSLIIVDATRVMVSNGPTGGRPSDIRITNTIVAAVDQVAADAWCYENLLQRDPAQLAYLDLAYQKFGSEPFQTTGRLGQRDWTRYKREGLLVETNVG